MEKVGEKAKKGNVDEERNPSNIYNLRKKTEKTEVDNGDEKNRNKMGNGDEKKKETNVGNIAEKTTLGKLDIVDDKKKMPKVDNIHKGDKKKVETVGDKSKVETVSKKKVETGDVEKKVGTVGGKKKVENYGEKKNMETVGEEKKVESVDEKEVDTAGENKNVETVGESNEVDEYDNTDPMETEDTISWFMCHCKTGFRTADGFLRHKYLIHTHEVDEVPRIVNGVEQIVYELKPEVEVHKLTMKRRTFPPETMLRMPGLTEDVPKGEGGDPKLHHGSAFVRMGQQIDNTQQEEAGKKPEVGNDAQVGNKGNGMILRSKSPKKAGNNSVKETVEPETRSPVKKKMKLTPKSQQEAAGKAGQR